MLAVCGGGGGGDEGRAAPARMRRWRCRVIQEGGAEGGGGATVAAASQGVTEVTELPYTKIETAIQYMLLALRRMNCPFITAEG